MAPLGNVPAIKRLIRRLKACERLDEIVLATTNLASDDVLVEAVSDENITVYRGDEHDVLRRVVTAHQGTGTDIIVEVTGDCPLLDWELVDQCVEMFLANECDYLATHLTPSYPRGFEVQVFGFCDLEWIEGNISDAAVREHVSLNFYEEAGRYRAIALVAPRSVSRPEYRLTLDYPEDLEVIDLLYRRLEPEFGENFQLTEIVEYLDSAPEVVAINANCEQRKPR